MSTAIPDRFAFTPIDWQLTDAADSFFFLQGTADRLNAAMDTAVRAHKRGEKPEQLVAAVRAVVTGERSDTGAAQAPTRDMVLQLLARITGVEQTALLDCWIGDQGKQFESLRAKAALAGLELYRTENAGRPVFIVAKWAEKSTFVSLDAVERYLQGGQP